MGWQAMCWAVGVLGVVIRAKTIGHVPPGTSGRNTAEGQVAESLNTRGMYSLVRHPLYLGNYFMWMALVLATGRLDFALLVTLAYMMYYLRIAMAEEAFLAGKFATYSDWAAVRPLCPNFGVRPAVLGLLPATAFLCATSSSANTTACSPLSLGCSSLRRPGLLGSAHPLGTPPHGKQGWAEVLGCSCSCAF